MDRVRLLLSACEHGEIPSVQGLLDEGLDVDSTDPDETTPLQVRSHRPNHLSGQRGCCVDLSNVGQSYTTRPRIMYNKYMTDEGSIVGRVDFLLLVYCSIHFHRTGT